MQTFCEDLANISFVTSHATTIYDQYMHDLDGLLGRHEHFFVEKAKKKISGWLSDSYLKAIFIKCQFEHIWNKIGPDCAGRFPGPVIKKGLRLSQVLGLNVVLKLRL